MSRVNEQLVRELTDRLSTYEARKRYHDAAEGAQWFAEREHREANQRLLDATRKRLNELDPKP